MRRLKEESARIRDAGEEEGVAEQSRSMQRMQEELRKMQRGVEQMSKEEEKRDESGTMMNEDELVMRDVGQSEQSSAPTRLNVGRGRKGKQRTSNQERWS